MHEAVVESVGYMGHVGYGGEDNNWHGLPWRSPPPLGHNGGGEEGFE